MDFWYSPVPEGNNAAFSEYVVGIAPERGAPQAVALHVWARSIDDALTCGEVLSAIYLAGDDSDW